MSHSGIVSFVEQYASEAEAVAAVGKEYFLGETNSGSVITTKFELGMLKSFSNLYSATCGGGGISPTFGAGLWVMDYALQGALAGVKRLYFHQGTIGDCVSLLIQSLLSFITVKRSPGLLLLGFWERLRSLLWRGFCLRIPWNRFASTCYVGLRKVDNCSLCRIQLIECARADSSIQFGILWRFGYTI